MGSNDTTSKIGEKKLRLVSVSSKPQDTKPPEGTPFDYGASVRKGNEEHSARNGTINGNSSVDDYVLTEKDKQGLAYENGYHSIKEFYIHEIMERNGCSVTPKERDYRKLWNIPEENISIEYEVERTFSFIGLKIPIGRTRKTATISSSTLEELANEKRNTKFYNVNLDYMSRGKLRALIDISLTILKIGDIEKHDAMFLLKNTYFALYVAVGRIEGVDAYYISGIPMLKNTISVKEEWREIRDEWSRLKKTYQTGGSDSTGLLLPSALVYERERTHLTQKPQAEEIAVETSTVKGTE